MSRYGYQDMPEGYSDVNAISVLITYVCGNCGHQWQETVPYESAADMLDDFEQKYYVEFCDRCSHMPDGG